MCKHHACLAGVSHVMLQQCQILENNNVSKNKCGEVFLRLERTKEKEKAKAKERARADTQFDRRICRWRTDDDA